MSFDKNDSPFFYFFFLHQIVNHHRGEVQGKPVTGPVRPLGSYLQCVLLGLLFGCYMVLYGVDKGVFN